MTLPVFLALPAEDVLLDPAGFPIALGDAQPGRKLYFVGSEADHARRSFRLQQGESFELVDGEGTRAQVTVAEVGDRGLEIECQTVIVEPQVAHPMWLVQALAKQGRDEQAVETCVELGADRVVPWQAQRSIVRWPQARADKAHQKWVNVVRSATKQSRRAALAPVEPLCNSKQLAKLVAQVVTGGGLVLLCHEESVVPLPQVVTEWLAQSPPGATQTSAPVVVIVGPEGGVADEEVSQLVEAGAQAVVLGPEVLRSSSAGAASMVALNYLLGRWPATSLH